MYLFGEGEREWGNAQAVQNSKDSVPNGDLGLRGGLFEESSMTQVGLRAGLVDSASLPTSCLYPEGGKREGKVKKGLPFHF